MGDGHPLRHQATEPLGQRCGRGEVLADATGEGGLDLLVLDAAHLDIAGPRSFG